MNDIDNLLLGAATAMATVYLVSPGAIWRLATTAGEWVLVILILILAL
jgi:hypothetical protein